mgnify:CR=1 FL=1
MQSKILSSSHRFIAKSCQLRNYHASSILLGSRPSSSKKKNDGEALDSEQIGRPEEFHAAAKDYLRSHHEFSKTKRIPKTREQFKKDEALANLYSRYVNIVRSKIQRELEKKKKLANEALDAMPEALRVEAKKTDWTDFPISTSLHPYVLPPMPDFKLPGQPLRNEM